MTTVNNFIDKISNEQTALLVRAPLDLRVNGLKANAASVRTQFPDAQPIAGLPHALRLPKGGAVEQSDAYRDGLIEIQDAGSQHIVAACEAKPGMTVVDLCAGAAILDTRDGFLIGADEVSQIFLRH